MKEVKKKVADRIGRIIILKVEMSGKNGPRVYRPDVKMRVETIELMDTQFFNEVVVVDAKK